MEFSLHRDEYLLKKKKKTREYFNPLLIEFVSSVSESINIVKNLRFRFSVITLASRFSVKLNSDPSPLPL